MAIIEWNEDLSVGVSALDRDHKHLIALLNQLHEVIRQKDSHEVVGIVLAELIHYAGHHFAAEEKLMERASFPGLEAHRDSHDMLRRQVADYHAEFLDNPRSVIAAELFEFLSAWLIHHIRTEDMAYGPALARH
jgi:hemerythrin